MLGSQFLFSFFSPSCAASCSDSILNHAVADLRKMGQRIFVFMIGGATRSEVKYVV